MIEQFTVENYRSYQKEEVLSFVASNKDHLLRRIRRKVASYLQSGIKK